ncbi:MAG: hypothetical protein U0694_19240 [Anaerolineae bacterium]
MEGRDGVDPLIALIGPDGNGLAANDDRDFEGGDYNSEIADFEAPDDGTVMTILIFHLVCRTERRSLRLVWRSMTSRPITTARTCELVERRPVAPAYAVFLSLSWKVGGGDRG